MILFLILNTNTIRENLRCGEGVEALISYLTYKNIVYCINDSSFQFRGE